MNANQVMMMLYFYKQPSDGLIATVFLFCKSLLRPILA